MSARAVRRDIVSFLGELIQIGLLLDCSYLCRCWAPFSIQTFPLGAGCEKTEEKRASASLCICPLFEIVREFYSFKLISGRNNYMLTKMQKIVAECKGERRSCARNRSLQPFTAFSFGILPRNHFILTM